MTSMVIIAVAWTALAAPAGLLVGRSMRIADRRDEVRRTQSPVPDFIPAEVLASVAQQRRPS